MCTVTIVPCGGGFRLMCNRDERLTRPTALQPRSTTVAGVWATYPIDRPSGGTWVGVNEAGLALALLNRTASTGRGDGREPWSRGDIVPRLIGARTLGDAAESLRSLDITRYPAFRLVAARGDRLFVGTSNGNAFAWATVPLSGPVVFTSSSLGDARAERVRVPLFHDLVRQARDPLAGQQAFHDHCWPDDTAFSVRMRRDDARTVSRTTVDAGGRRTSLHYEVLPEGA